MKNRKREPPQIGVALTLGDRLYCYPKCGNLMDRDHQAAVNIDREGFQLFCAA